MASKTSIDQGETVFRSPFGDIDLLVSDSGIRLLAWRNQPLKNESASTSIGLSSKVEAILDEAIFELKSYFSGRLRAFNVPLDIAGTDFQKQVWFGLLSIPYGETVSYSQQAEMLGRPGSERAVASANAKNPIAIVLPCHRVIGADGSLRGYNGGLEKKRKLLSLEADFK